MTSFNEWLYQRDENIYNEMFDTSEEEVGAKVYGGSFKYEINPGKKPVKIYLSKIGSLRLKNSVQHTKLNMKNLELVGSELMHTLKKIPIEKDIDVTPLRKKFSKVAPSSVLTLDAILKRFATRAQREVGDNGNLLFSDSSASIGLRNSLSPDKYRTYPRRSGARYDELRDDDPPPSNIDTTPEADIEADKKRSWDRFAKHHRLFSVRHMPSHVAARKKEIEEEYKKQREQALLDLHNRYKN
jgi:hypothetical protein